MARLVEFSNEVVCSSVDIFLGLLVIVLVGKVPQNTQSTIDLLNHFGIAYRSHLVYSIKIFWVQTSKFGAVVKRRDLSTILVRPSGAGYLKWMKFKASLKKIGLRQPDRR